MLVGMAKRGKISKETKGWEWNVRVAKKEDEACHPEHFTSTADHNAEEPETALCSSHRRD